MGTTVDTDARQEALDELLKIMQDDTEPTHERIAAAREILHATGTDIAMDRS